MNRIRVAVLALTLSACLPVPEPKIVWVAAPFDQAGEAADSRAKIKNGDIVRVITKDGKKMVLDVHQVDDTTFHGVSLKDHRKYHVHYAALKQLEVRRWGVGLTTLTIQPN